MVRSGPLSWANRARTSGLSAAVAAAPPITPVAPAAMRVAALGMREVGACRTYQAATNSSARSRTRPQSSSPRSSRTSIALNSSRSVAWMWRRMRLPFLPTRRGASVSMCRRNWARPNSISSSFISRRAPASCAASHCCVACSTKLLTSRCRSPTAAARPKGLRACSMSAARRSRISAEASAGSSRCAPAIRAPSQAWCALMSSVVPARCAEVGVAFLGGRAADSSRSRRRSLPANRLCPPGVRVHASRPRRSKSRTVDALIPKSLAALLIG